MKAYILILIASLLLLTSCENTRQKKTEAGKNWPIYLGGNSSAQYSPLRQINKDNVHLLEVAWKYQSGDIDKNNRSQIQCNPLIINGILYGTSPKLKAFALDAQTGEELWVFDPNEEVIRILNANRGVTYWTDGEDERIFFTAGPNLFCLDARTGKLVESFGNSGKAPLNAGFEEYAKDLCVVSTSPGIIYKNKLIIGTRVSEYADAAPGHIRAFDVITGELVWIFRTIPHPGEYGYDTWPEDAYLKVGGANSWSGMSLDEKRGMVFVPTGSASYDFWGGNRKGKNLFANCILALDAETGKRKWHFQTVYHDLWDRDLPAPPNLVTVTHNGKKIDAVAQITKSGYVYVLNRDTGESLFPIEERPVPASDLEGEETWPVQPFPVKPPPFARQQFMEEDITNISKESHKYVAGILANIRTGGQYVPPSKEGTMIFPGFDGGGEWGGAAYDPESGLLYVNANENPWILTMIELDAGKPGKTDLGASVYQSACAMCHGQDRRGDPTGAYPSLVNIESRYGRQEIMRIIDAGRGFMPGFKHLKEHRKEALVNYLMGIENEKVSARDASPAFNSVLYSHTGYNRFTDQDGHPAVKPPWGTLNAIDLNAGEIKWQVVLGEIDSLTAKGIPKTGTENYGGPVVTAGGLIFIGATKDEYFRAFDKETGDELWKYKLPAGGYATPASYEIDGEQYLVIACGGGKMGTKSGDTYVAFKLKK